MKVYEFPREQMRQNISRTFIIIKGQPKSLQIEWFQMDDNGVYHVKFKNSTKTYYYRHSDVVCIKNAVWHNHLHCKVYIGGREQQNVSDIRSFPQEERTHWRIKFNNGYSQDYLHGSVKVVESCLADNITKNTFDYLKSIASLNKLGKDEEHGGILSAQYEKIGFINQELAAATYLNPNETKKNKVKYHRSSGMIFPFGCNASQEKAVSAAFKHQISVIQGPPGTGKTQTILNIIANILEQGKTVMVVSNNNSATANVLEKLKKYGFDFLVAPLGRKENKEEFINNQPTIPDELKTWNLSMSDTSQLEQATINILNQLRKIFALQEQLAEAKQELKALELEWTHFKQDNDIKEDTYTAKRSVKAKRLMSLWIRYQAYTEGDMIAPTSIIGRFLQRMKWEWLNFTRKYILGIKSPLDKNNVQLAIQELQALYYLVRIRELTALIEEVTNEMSTFDAKSLSEKLTTHSMNLLKSALYDKYHNSERPLFSKVEDLSLYAEELLKQYPVVLSTTFSARTSVPDMVYDYLIMDEASQVSIETGALALTCAKNAVIVGDTLQLPNVVTEDDKQKLNTIFKGYNVEQGYNCADYSFLQSVCTVIPNITQTLLREHYRCHPKIINFCNQRFYAGNLLIMTEDHGEENVMMAIKTAPGHHTRGNYNQREIDVVNEEVLPMLNNITDVGIITPYNLQVREFNNQITTIETATIHKYQGREKDAIIMSVVDDQISEFTDDPNLLNVAISRAKKKFCLVVSGNEQKRKGNITELMDYIAYNNFSVTDSKISSIFDYLYSNYTKERMAFLAGHRNISEFDTENLTFSLIENILHEYPEFAHLGVCCHIPVRSVIKDWSLLNEKEQKYISHYSTHLDFLIINHVTKMPVLAIEVDGFNYHKKGTEQEKRDKMKNHILKVYGLRLLRLCTTGNGEQEKIVNALKNIYTMEKIIKSKDSVHDASL